MAEPLRLNRKVGTGVLPHKIEDKLDTINMAGLKNRVKCLNKMRVRN
jgi:hypothetical protein